MVYNSRIVIPPYVSTQPPHIISACVRELWQHQWFGVTKVWFGDTNSVGGTLTDRVPLLIPPFGLVPRIEISSVRDKPEHEISVKCHDACIAY